jgi:Family of unknown function (DUF5677)
VVSAQLGLTERENCFLASYHREGLDLKSAITLNDARHFPAVAKIARGLFELAVEIRLIYVIPDAVPKMVAFQRLERLKAAQKAVAFASTHTLEFSIDLSPYRAFIAANQVAIEAEAIKFWGNLKATHWTKKDLSKRAALLGKPFEEIYESLYKILSWHVHPGIAGIVNMKPETFPYLFGISCQIAARSYEEILRAVIKEFRISAGTPDIDNKLTFAKLRAGAKGDPEIEAKMRRELGLKPMEQKSPGGKSGPHPEH